MAEEVDDQPVSRPIEPPAPPDLTIARKNAKAFVADSGLPGVMKDHKDSVSVSFPDIKVHARFLPNGDWVMRFADQEHHGKFPSGMNHFVQKVKGELGE